MGRRGACVLAAGLSLVVVAVVDCTGLGDAPLNQGPPAGPTEPPPTGTRWEAVPTEHCGRLGLEWVLVDEVCGGTDDPGYLDGFQVPMFRDGALLGNKLFVVDATHLWVLDVSRPESPRRLALASGFGRPLAVEAFGRKLLLASGDEGLVVVEASDAEHPVREAAVPLPGPALDVTVAGALAYVAAGRAGLCVVDLGAKDPELVQCLPVPGFAASAAVRRDVAYVAACDTVALLHLPEGKILGRTWVSGAYDGRRLVAPAKGIVLDGDLAYVAAGRWGAVAIDVSDRRRPAVLGNCTLAEDPSFHASGVRIAGGRLYVAGGEWGVLGLPLGEPAGPCRSTIVPDPPADPEQPGDECSSEPPWVVMPWQEMWAPPPPRRDPVQTLPAGDVLYAFGDARRIGLRAVDVRSTASEDLPQVGRYDEPRLVTDVVARDGRVLVVGPGGGVFERDPAALLAAVAAPDPVRSALAGALLEDGRWVVATGEGTIHVEGGASARVEATIWPHGIAALGNGFVVSIGADLLLLPAEPDGAGRRWRLLRPAELPPAIAVRGEDVLVAAPEWTAAELLHGDRPVELQPHGVFDEDEIVDAGLWTEGLPRRMLGASSRGVVEVASLGRRAGLVLHGAVLERVELPPATYVDAAVDGDTAYLVAADRGAYRSQLVVVDVSGGEPQVAHLLSFVGAAAAVAADGDRLYVGDADRGVRVFAREGASLEYLGLVDAEVSP